MAYEVFNGSIPAGAFVLHRCDNPPCVNPTHLYLGDAKQNARDRDDRGRTARGERSPWAKLTQEKAAGIRARVAAGASKSAVSREFGVSRQTVLRVARGLDWCARTPVEAT